MPGSNINAMNIDSRGPGKSGSSAGSNSVTGTSSSISPEIAEKAEKNVQSITKTFIDANQKSVDMLIMINNESHKFTLDQPQPFWGILHNHSNMVNLNIEQRMYWVEQMSKSLPDNSRKEIEKMLDKKSSLFENYLTKVEKLGDRDGELKGKLTEFFNLTNAFRNAANKELNGMESIIHENIRRDPLYKNSNLKQSVNLDYPKSKKAFSDQDSLLKKRMSEILNAPKK